MQSQEKDITLIISLLVGDYISQSNSNVEVVYTRDTDKFVDLPERVGIANRLKADLFISIHVNASTNTDVRGLEVYAFGGSKDHENLEVARRENAVVGFEDIYNSDDGKFHDKKSEYRIISKYIQNQFIDRSIEFAVTLCNELKSCVSWADRGVKQAEYLILRKAHMPRVLVELDFITNPEAEMYLLSENGQKRYAMAICSAFEKYKADYIDCNIKIPTEITCKTSSLDKNDQLESIKNNTGDKIYKVQIFASSSKLPENSPQFKGYKVSCYEVGGLYKYTCGSLSDYDEALKIQKTLLEVFDGAFVVCIKNEDKC